MASLFAGIATRAGAAGASEPLRQLSAFWLREFLSLFPPRIARWLAGRRDARLVLAAEVDGIALRLVADGAKESAAERLARADYAPAAVDTFLHKHKLKRREVKLGVRLPRSRVFCRSLTLPREAIG